MKKENSSKIQPLPPDRFPLTGQGGLDINCDMGEGTGNDETLMPYITSANIACGYHAGDEETIRTTMLLAKQHGVRVGAHPSFFDRPNFGRKEQKTSPTEVYQLVMEQLSLFARIALAIDTPVLHVKPHGALYNMAAKNNGLAKAIAQAVQDFDENLMLFGLSGSASITEAEKLGLRTYNEVFADRTYQDDGSLTPRSQHNALIEDEERSVAQVLQMVQDGTVTSVSGKKVPLKAETVCIHGDGKNAVAFAARLAKALQPQV